MTSINNLSSDDALSQGDLVPIYSNGQGVTRKATVAAFVAAIGDSYVTQAQAQANAATLTVSTFQSMVYPGVYAIFPTTRPNGTAMQDGDRAVILLGGVPTEYVRSSGAWTTITGTSPGALAASSGSSLVGFLQSGTGAVPRTAQDKMREPVSAADLGLTGSGADETAAFSRVLNDPRDVVIDAGTYVINAGAITVSGGVAKKITGRGNVIISCSLPAATNLATFNRSVSFKGITFDFNNSNVQYALLYNANCGDFDLKNLVFRNLKDIGSTYGTILVNINPGGNVFDIDGIDFLNLLKRGNGSVTDAAGSLNCIYVGGTGTYAVGSIANITGTEIHNIDASSAVIYEDTTMIYIITPSTDALNDVSIANVWGYNFGKRMLKIHASNVMVENITGNSTTGDSNAVIAFLDGQGLGEKYGNSASHVRAYGKMEFAFYSYANGTKWKDVIAYVTPGTKSGMTNVGTGLLIAGNDTDVDGLESGSDRLLTIGSPTQIVKNTNLRKIKLVIDTPTSGGFISSSDTSGYDGLVIDGLYIAHAAIAVVVPVDLETYLNGTTIKGRNVSVRDVQIVTAAATNGYGLLFGYCENIALTNYRYINTSSNTHFRSSIFDNCANVNVDSVVAEGTLQTCVYVNTCTGRNTVNRVQATGATVAAVFNNNSADVIVQNCDTTKVSGATTATPQNTKYTVATTANRPTTGLVAGFSQHFDTTLGKPIWWNGAQWKDATGATV